MQCTEGPLPSAGDLLQLHLVVLVSPCWVSSCTGGAGDALITGAVRVEKKDQRFALAR